MPTAFRGKERERARLLEELKKKRLQNILDYESYP
jgi:hypothetical protein